MRGNYWISPGDWVIGIRRVGDEICREPVRVEQLADGGDIVAEGITYSNVEKIPLTVEILRESRFVEKNSVEWVFDPSPGSFRVEVDNTGTLRFTSGVTIPFRGEKKETPALMAVVQHPGVDDLQRLIRQACPGRNGEIIANDYIKV